MLTDEGIKERGTHKELMELDGEYAHMVKFTQLTRKVLKMCYTNHSYNENVNRCILLYG